MAIDIRALARSKYDPMRFQGEYRAEKKRLRDAMDARYAANLNTDSRSAARRNDPDQSLSVESQMFPGVFGAGADPVEQEQQRRRVARHRGPNLQPATPGLRRRDQDQQFSFNDMGPDDFLRSLGIGIGLRRGV